MAGRSDYLLLTIGLTLAQIAYSYKFGQVRLRLILQLFAVGLLLEGIAIALGTLDFAGGLFPLWLMCLWLSFAAMAPLALDWLAEKTGLAVLLGATSGPFTYWVGLSFDAATTDSVLQMVITYAAVWGLFMLFFSRAMKASPGERLIL